MTRFALALLLLVSTPSFAARGRTASEGRQDTPKKNLPVIDAKEFASRRATLMEKFADGVVLVWRIDEVRQPAGG